MKKSYLMIAATALLLAACSETDTFKEVDNQDVAIGFSSIGVNKTTRADITLGWLKTINNAFGVYGFKGAAGATGTTNLFVNEEVTYQNISTGYDDWRHPTVRFWDKSSEAYNFYAYAPYGAYNMAWDNTKGFSFSQIPVIKVINNDQVDDIVVAAAVESYSYTKSITNHPSTNHPSHNDPAEGYVPFIFHHVLSKLGFKVKTHEDYTTTAEFTVKKIELNFPSATGVTWSESNKNDVAGTTTYSGYQPVVNTDVTFETEVYNNTTGQIAEYTANEIGKEFIVTPVNTSDVTGHAFDIKVTYDVQYKKESAPNSGTYVNDVKEENCVATGSIAATTYKPGQNEYWTITIDINPAKIEFCVDKVEDWTTDLNGSTTGDGQPDPVEVK